MKPFEIFIAYISWGGGGKSRPVLVYSQGGDDVSIHCITSRYDSKSEVVKANYFRIVDWQYSGLDRPSYIDTGTRFELPKSIFDGKNPVGRLSDADIDGLLDFLGKDMGKGRSRP